MKSGNRQIVLCMCLSLIAVVVNVPFGVHAWGDVVAREAPLFVVGDDIAAARGGLDPLQGPLSLPNDRWSLSKGITRDAVLARAQACVNAGAPSSPATRYEMVFIGGGVPRIWQPRHLPRCENVRVSGCTWIIGGRRVKVLPVGRRRRQTTEAQRHREPHTAENGYGSQGNDNGRTQRTAACSLRSRCRSQLFSVPPCLCGLPLQ